MSSKTDVQKTNASRRADDENAPETPQGSNLTGTLIRGALIVGLLVFMLKPYLTKPAETTTPTIFSVDGRTMGTVWSASVCADAERLAALNQNPETGEELAKSCEELLKKFVQRELDKVDLVASTYKKDSEISRFNASRSTDWFAVSPETAKIVAVAQDVAQKTGGAFDVTVAPLVDLYRFGPNKTPLVALPTDEEVAKLKERVGYDKLEVRTEPEPALRKTVPELTLDLSGVAKGFAADLVAQAFENAGLADYMIEVGGEVRCGGKKKNYDFAAATLSESPWTLGIETPEISADVADFIPAIYRTIKFENGGSLATSGDYRNFLQVGETRFSHIVDPRTGKPTEIVENGASEPGERLGAVSVVAPTCAEADAFATAFFVLGEKSGLELADKLGISVLYLNRADDAATEIREAASQAFSQSVNSQLFK